MGYRTALQEGTVLPFENMPCRVDTLLERGSNALVYRGHCLQTGSGEAEVLIRELFPRHPQGEIFRDNTGASQILFQEDTFWHAHKDSFLASVEIHRRRLLDHPVLSGYPLHVFSCNNTFYTVMPLSGSKLLSQAALQPGQTLLVHTRRILGLLDALEAYHKCSYLHLNIEPSQILLMDMNGQEQIILMHNYLLGQESGTRPGFSAPETENGIPESSDFSTDLYSVTAVFFYCLMGRALALEELLRSGGPSLKTCQCLSGELYPVRQLVSKIFKQGLHVLPSRRFRSIGQMRKTFLELQNRILHQGITHWSLWEYGRKTAEEWAAELPVSGELYPHLASWLRQGKRRSASVPALMIIPDASADAPILQQILSNLHMEEDDRTRKILESLLQEPIADETPVLLLVVRHAQTISPEACPELSALASLPGLQLLDDHGMPLQLPT